MKKLLSLLSVLTISGTAVPITIAASPYQKKENNNNINYQQINNLKNLNRNKRESNFNKKISLKKIEGITGVGSFFQRQENEIFIDNKNNIYFKTNDGVYKLLKNDYVAKKIDNVYLINNSIKNANDNNGNVYFPGIDDTMYVVKNGETVPIKIEGINDTAREIVINKNNDNVYVGGYKGAYIIKSGTTTAIKIEGINSSFGIYSKILMGYDNTVYFVTENRIYNLLIDELKATIITDFGGEDLNDVEFNSLITNGPILYFKTKRNFVYSFYFNHSNARKVSDNIINSFVVDKQNYIYYSTNEGTFTIRNYVHHGDEHHKLSEITKWDKIVFDSDNNGYFIKQNKFYKSNNTFELNEIKNVFGNKINSVIFNSKNDVYIIVYTDENNVEKQLFFLKNGENNVTSIKNENNNILFFSDEIITFDKLDNLYLFRLDRFDNDKHIYRILLNQEISEKINLQKSYGYFRWYSFDNNNNLYFILDDGIYFLEKNKYEIIKIFGSINSDNMPSIRKVVINNKNELYFIFDYLGGWNFKLENNYKLENNVNFLNLIKLSYYFSRDIKEIKSIDINNLDFDNVEVTRNKDLNWSFDFKNICFATKERKNNSSIKKTVIIPKCEYNQKSKFMFQIIKGISKDGKDNSPVGWTLNMYDENKLWDFININYRDKTITHTLSNNFVFSNLNKQEQEMILYLFNEPEDKIDLAPNEKATILYSVRENKYESNLNLKQKITGTITAKIIDNFNKEQIITLSIKEVIQILQNYRLLPNEITINEDNSITFSGKAIISSTIDNNPKLILNTEII